jgi:hypothetical protein
MHQLLSRYLEKLGISKVTDLTPEEQVTFDGWKSILSKDKLEVADIATFCRNQIGLIERQWRDNDSSPRRNERLIAQHVVYKTLLEAINAPQQERELLERQLEDKILNLK